jgi:hypothetical protein
VRTCTAPQTRPGLSATRSHRKRGRWLCGTCCSLRWPLQSRHRRTALKPAAPAQSLPQGAGSASAQQMAQAQGKVTAQALAQETAQAQGTASVQALARGRVPAVAWARSDYCQAMSCWQQEAAELEFLDHLPRYLKQASGKSWKASTSRYCAWSLCCRGVCGRGCGGRVVSSSLQHCARVSRAARTSTGIADGVASSRIALHRQGQAGMPAGCGAHCTSESRYSSLPPSHHPSADTAHSRWTAARRRSPRCSMCYAQARSGPICDAGQHSGASRLRTDQMCTAPHLQAAGNMSNQSLQTSLCCTVPIKHRDIVCACSWLQPIHAQLRRMPHRTTQMRSRNIHSQKCIHSTSLEPA